METNKLIRIAENKGIISLKEDKSLFRKYSYFQDINAYKNFFVYDEDDIDKIKTNIANNDKIKIEFYRKSFQIKKLMNKFFISSI